MKPYCFLDVDGVLNTVHANEETGHDLVCEGFKIRIPKTFKANVERLMEHYEMVWLTTWEHMANEHFCPFFGWDEWPVIEWIAHDRLPDEPRGFKLLALPKWFEEHGDRPWCFIDDDAPWELTELHQRDWDVADHLPSPYLLLHPDTYVGLTTQHTDDAIAFAEANVQ